MGPGCLGQSSFGDDRRLEIIGHKRRHSVLLTGTINFTESTYRKDRTEGCALQKLRFFKRRLMGMNSDSTPHTYMTRILCSMANSTSQTNKKKKKKKT